jgi:hypothetical protein
LWQKAINQEEESSIGSGRHVRLDESLQLRNPMVVHLHPARIL